MVRGLEIILKGRDPRDDMGLLRARVRRLHDRTRPRLGPLGQRRARHLGAAQRGAHPQHHVLHAAHAGPRGPLLPFACPGLG